jgi:S-(hydroxymethyl)glutathione dehydrogenase/alcohol dehydrogenase
LSAGDPCLVRAAVLEACGQPPRIEELVLDAPAAGEVLVRLEASGVCHSDLHQADGDWGETGPMVLGHEGCGVVTVIGPGVDPALRGRRVVLNWFAPCLTCGSCQAGRQRECTGTTALSSRLPDGTSRLRRRDGTEVLPFLGLGTFAEAAVVPAVAAVPIDQDIDPAAAALIGCCVSTGVGAVLKTASVPAGASVVVYGLGGVGLSIVMGAVLAGATSIVVSTARRRSWSGPSASGRPPGSSPARRTPTRGRRSGRRPAVAPTSPSRPSACAPRSSWRSARCEPAARWCWWG